MGGFFQKFGRKCPEMSLFVRMFGVYYQTIGSKGESHTRFYLIPRSAAQTLDTIECGIVAVLPGDRQRHTNIKTSAKALVFLYAVTCCAWLETALSILLLSI